MELSQVLGHTATVLFTIMLIPQIIKTIRTKSVKDVSLPMFFIALTANIVALCYAMLINQLPLIIKYILGIMTIIGYIWIYYWVKDKK